MGSPMAKKTQPQNPGTKTREERLKEALKANMGRRKAQAKARAQPKDSNEAEKS